MTDPALTRILTSDGTPHGAIAQSAFTFDGQVLRLTGDSIQIGTRYIESVQGTNIGTGTTTLTSISVLSGKSAHFDYVIYNSLGHSRAGTVMVVWNSTNVTFVDTATPDLDGSTLDVLFNVTNDSTNINLTIIIGSGNWNVLVSSKIIF